MKAMIIVVAIASMLLISGIAVAVEDIQIIPEENPITVGVDPNPISPPVMVIYTGWNTSGGSSYEVVVTNDQTNVEVCRASGTIAENPFPVVLTGCILPASSINIPHTIEASGSCPQGSCDNPKRSKTLILEAALNPIPELSTISLVSVGLIGLLGLVRLRRRDYK